MPAAASTVAGHSITSDQYPTTASPVFRVCAVDPGDTFGIASIVWDSHNCRAQSVASFSLGYYDALQHLQLMFASIGLHTRYTEQVFGIEEFRVRPGANLNGQLLPAALGGGATDWIARSIPMPSPGLRPAIVWLPPSDMTAGYRMLESPLAARWALGSALAEAPSVHARDALGHAMTMLRKAISAAGLRAI